MQYLLTKYASQNQKYGAQTESYESQMEIYDPQKEKRQNYKRGMRHKI